MTVAFYVSPFTESAREIQVSAYLESKGFSSDEFYVAMLRIPVAAKIMFVDDISLQQLYDRFGTTSPEMELGNKKLGTIL